MDDLTIGSLAKSAGVNVETIRYYERRGLLRRPVRPPSGYRKYLIEAIKQVRFIKRAQGLGFSLGEIKELLNLGSEAQADCAEVLSLARCKVAELESKIKTLEAMKTALGKLTRDCPGTGGLSRCPIWESFEGEDERR
jgi:MerR family mercuric resistance operon transcriptional regulator